MLSPLVVLVSAAAFVPACAAVLARHVPDARRIALAGAGAGGVALLVARVPLRDDLAATSLCALYALASLVATALLVRRGDARSLRPLAGGVLAAVTLLLAALAWVTHLGA